MTTKALGDHYYGIHLCPRLDLCLGVDWDKTWEPANIGKRFRIFG